MAKNLFIAVSAFLILAGCASIQPPCPVCPPEEIVIMTPWGPMRIEEGQLRPDTYYTIPEWDQMIEELYGSQHPKMSM